MRKINEIRSYKVLHRMAIELRFIASQLWGVR